MNELSFFDAVLRKVEKVKFKAGFTAMVRCFVNRVGIAAKALTVQEIRSVAVLRFYVQNTDMWFFLK